MPKPVHDYIQIILDRNTSDEMFQIIKDSINLERVKTKRPELIAHLKMRLNEHLDQEKNNFSLSAKINIALLALQQFENHVPHTRRGVRGGAKRNKKANDDVQVANNRNAMFGQYKQPKRQELPKGLEVLRRK